MQILASKVKSAITDRCKEAKLFSVIADGTTDITYIDQLSTLVRFVAVDRLLKKVSIEEHFLEFSAIKNANADGLCQIIANVLFSDCGFEKRHLVGQSYDGASVMCGTDGGVQAKLKNFVKNHSDFVPYVHCPPRQINLVLVHAAEGTAKRRAPVEVMNFFGTLQEVYNFFSSSNRHWDILMDAMKSETRSNTSNEFAVVFDDIISLNESEAQEYSSKSTNTSTPELSETATSSELDSSDDVSLKRKPL